MEVKINNEIKEIAQFIQSKGWAERNAGNISYRLDFEPNFEILISKSGACFRDMAKQAEANCCKIQHMLPHTQNPSSELPTHLLIHKLNKPGIRAIVHTHPTHLIAFSHKYSTYSKEMINALLSSIMPEVSMYIPSGIGVVELYPPGSHELAKATEEEFKHHDIVIWKKHGCIAISDTLWGAVDLIDIVDKAAYISLLAGLK